MGHHEQLGVDLDRAKETLRSADITGTSDEPPEEAGRRQMVIHVTGERLTIEATDPVITEAGETCALAGTSALSFLGVRFTPGRLNPALKYYCDVP